jgi:hypothetical protein
LDFGTTGPLLPDDAEANVRDKSLIAPGRLFTERSSSLRHTRPMSDEAWRSPKDRRREVRVSADIDARLLPGGLVCRITDRSAGGARVRLVQPGVLPTACVLVEWPTGRAHEAQVMWRQGSEAGLRFTRSCDLRGMVPAIFVDAKRLWSARV